MKNIKFLLTGIFFGIVLTKSEAVSWYRIYEMFHFQSFHMYGIIMMAIVTGVTGIQIYKRRKIKNTDREVIQIPDKERGFTRYLAGGILFGLGWALAGACPGPMYILFGAGFWSMGIVILGALAGTFVYGLLKDKLPH